jgi:hypothetical protein
VHMSKSRLDYLEVLNLDENATSEMIETRFNELFSDFQIRLTNAPTANLKKLYQKNLQELESAYAGLTEGIDKNNSRTTRSDLPSSKPIQSTNYHNQNNPPNLGNTPPIRTDSTVVAGRSAKAQNKEAAPATGISLTAFIVTIVVALACIALLTTLYIEGKSEVASVHKEAEKNAEFLRLRNIIKNGKFKVENRTEEIVTLYITHVTFFNNQGVLEEFKFLGGDNNPKPVSVILNPGKTVSINQYDGPIKWDGSVVSYAMLIYKGSSLSSVYSGIWLHEWPENKLVISNL